MRRKALVTPFQFLLIVLLLTLSFVPLALSAPETVSAEHDPCEWTSMSSGTSSILKGVWGSSATDVFAVGYGGCITHYDGVSWSPMNSGTTNPLFGVWGSSSSDVFAVGGYGTILYYDGNTWSPISITSEHLACVWGSSSSDVFAAGQEVILHYDGATWQTMMTLETPSHFGPPHIWGSSHSDVYVVGIGDFGIWHYDGNTWVDISSSVAPLMAWYIYGVWGSSPSDVFVAGQGGIVHFDGSSWGLMSSGLAQHDTAVAVWGSAWNDVYAVGWGGGASDLIVHYDGTAWTSSRSGTPGGLYGVWCSPSSDVLAVGYNGTVLHHANRVPPQMASASPAQGSWCDTLDITITGSHFTGVDRVSLGYGITVNSFTVKSDTEIAVNVTITVGVSPGYTDVFVATPCEEATLTAGFRIDARPMPEMVSVSTNHGKQGETLDITIGGNYLTGVDSVSFSDGIAVNGFTVNSDTEIAANVTIDKDADLGDRNISVVAPQGSATLDSGFTVKKDSAAGLAIWAAVAAGVVLLVAVGAYVLAKRRPRHP